MQHQMQVIWHEDVRSNRELQLRCGSHYLIEHEVDRLGAGEDGRALMCAERQEIVMPAAVIERLEARALADHACKSCNEQAAVVGRLPDHARAALKGCATGSPRGTRKRGRPGGAAPRNHPG